MTATANRPQLLRNARLVDLEAGSVTEGAWIRVDGGRVAGIGAGEPAAGDSAVEELGGAFVIPGLWDVHVHPAGYQPPPPGETTAGRTLRTVEVTRVMRTREACACVEE